MSLNINSTSCRKSVVRTDYIAETDSRIKTAGVVESIALPIVESLSGAQIKAEIEKLLSSLEKDLKSGIVRPTPYSIENSPKYKELKNKISEINSPDLLKKYNEIIKTAYIEKILNSPETYSLSILAEEILNKLKLENFDMFNPLKKCSGDENEAKKAILKDVNNYLLEDDFEKLKTLIIKRAHIEILARRIVNIQTKTRYTVEKIIVLCEKGQEVFDSLRKKIDDLDIVPVHLNFKSRFSGLIPQIINTRKQELKGYILEEISKEVFDYILNNQNFDSKNIEDFRKILEKKLKIKISQYKKESNTEREFIKKYNKNLTVFFRQGISDVNDCLGLGLCFALTNRMSETIRNNPTVSDDKLCDGEILPSDRRMQAFYLVNFSMKQIKMKKEKTSIASAKKNILKRKNTIQNELYHDNISKRNDRRELQLEMQELDKTLFKVHLLPSELCDCISEELLGVCSIDGLCEFFNKNMSSIEKSNGVLKIALRGHLILVQIDQKNKIYRIYDSNFGVFRFKGKGGIGKVSECVRNLSDTYYDNDRLENIGIIQSLKNE